MWLHGQRSGVILFRSPVWVCRAGEFMPHATLGSGGWAQDIHLIGSNAIEELEAFVVEAGQPRAPRMVGYGKTHHISPLWAAHHTHDHHQEPTAGLPKTKHRVALARFAYSVCMVHVYVARKRTHIP